MTGLLFVLLTGAVIVGLVNRIYVKTNDPLHPVILFAIPLAGMYVLQPLLLFIRDPRTFEQFLSDDHFAVVAIINLLGAGAMLLGALGPTDAAAVPPLLDQSTDNKRLFRLSILFGGLAIGGYLFCIYQVGGFYQAYGRAYGGGWSNIGYVRESYWLAIPAITMLAISKKRLRSTGWLLAICYASPLLAHGLLGARRGPTAAALVTMWLARSVATGKRPSLPQMVSGMVCLALLLLALVANRGTIGIGRQTSFSSGVESYATTAGSSNEYIYGGAVVLASHRQNVHFYGRRYLTVVFIRPIPVQLFPSKYAFAAKYLAIPNLALHGSNLGTGELDFLSVMGWKPAVGAAPGLIADLWLEFWVFYIPALWCIGRFYWFAWHRLRHGKRFWVIAYTVMSALSIYLITQTLEAMLFRFLLATGCVVLMWYVSEGRLPDFGYRLLPRRWLHRESTFRHSS